MRAYVNQLVLPSPPVRRVLPRTVAMAHPLPVEEDEPEQERGHHLHPEPYGAPEQQSLAWVRHPR
ncbi:hypothetical protein ACFV0O_28720 [Kitasatospora sp. NPDC059577]|uniref:hypothetical protein n=1 Tax=Kitasatospora sp. NPDC059577 TaxID=3346873 RepID=UPI0036B69B5C